MVNPIFNNLDQIIRTLLNQFRFRFSQYLFIHFCFTPDNIADSGLMDSSANLGGKMLNNLPILTIRPHLLVEPDFILYLLGDETILSSHIWCQKSRGYINFNLFIWLNQAILIFPLNKNKDILDIFRVLLVF